MARQPVGKRVNLPVPRTSGQKYTTIRLYRGSYLCHVRKASERHKHTARLWQAWIERAWPAHAVIWAGWSEVGLPGRRNPDGLSWGTLDGQDTLFWLEVESGHTSAKNLRPKMARRFDRALAYARSFGVRLLYAVLGKDRVLEETVRVFRNVPPDAAVVMGNWIEFGRLPFAVWGMVRR